MRFSSLLFLFVFFPWFLARISQRQNGFGTVFYFLEALFFTAGGNRSISPSCFFLLWWILSTESWQAASVKREIWTAAKWVVASSAAINLGLLIIFKYTDFFIRSFNELTGSSIPLLGLALPIGISFYTFQTMSYTIDVYRGQAPVQNNLISFGAYVSMFPQLIAGSHCPLSGYCAGIKQPPRNRGTVCLRCPPFYHRTGKKGAAG